MRTRIKNYVRAGYPGLCIISAEEQRVEAEIKAVAKDIAFDLSVWSVTTGIVNIESGNGSGAEDPIEMLDAFAKLPEKSILICRDFHMFLADPNPMIVRKLKDALTAAKSSNRVLITVGCQLKLPPELEKEMTVVEFKLPDKDQLRVVLDGIAASAGITLNGNVDSILDAASGLTTRESEDAFALSVVTAGDIMPHIVANQKAETVRKNGILEIVETKSSLADIGGLDVLKSWLSKRKHSYSKAAQEFGLPVAKGCLAVGIPGTGKSLTAKAAANILGVPLLKLDGGKIFGSLVGESERNLRIAIQTAEAVAPCVLFVDELEKAFSGSKSSGSTDGGTASRVFGTFLQWLNDKTSPVFVFATANDISQLPPEFLRKGRLDELFFCDLPSVEERVEIWNIHISRRGRKPEDYDVDCLAQRTEGFTGAEIEAAFTESLFAGFDEGREPTTEDVINALNNTVPLSKTMAPQIDALRQWANGRARRASSPKAEAKAGRKFA